MRRVNLARAHGSWRGYSDGCRCAMCLRAWSAYTVACKASGNHRHPHTTRECDNPACTRAVTISVSHVGRSRYHYCCHPCAMKGRSAHYRGRTHSSFKGGRYFSASGYVLLTIAALDPADRVLAEPMGQGRGAVLEHRLVVARSLGRPLTDSEQVHHINGIKDDNRPENLEAVGISGHARDHWHNQAAGQRAAYLESEVVRLRALVGEGA